MSAASPFPSHFLWGAATSAYQVEGHPLADGAGPSIWHRFSHEPGRIARGETGDLACDHYNRAGEDVALMAELSLGAYRFSVAWGRVLPQGRGAVSQKGLDFYQRLVDALLEHGIQPMVTLYHWDLPEALQRRGGWLSPDSPEWLADYAGVLFAALDDRVPLWVTINEPWVASVLGHLEGVHAPGHRDPAEAARVTHHLLLAHARAVECYRALGRGQIGIALNLEPQYPASGAEADIVAAERRDTFVNRWLLDPLYLGRYPAEMADVFGPDWPAFPADEIARIGIAADFIGVNYYSRGWVRADPDAPPPRAARLIRADVPSTAMGWEIYPSGLTETLLRLKTDYGNPPVYITENGAAFDDPAPRDGLIQDRRRIDYLREHVAAAGAAIQAGADLRGYFVWSLLDNFEWAEGYSKRFGLYGVDPRDQRRLPKASAGFYRRVIDSNGADLEDPR